MPDHIRNLLISLASHMAYMQGQLEADHQFGELEDYYWYRESVALRQKVNDAIRDAHESLLADPRQPSLYDH